MLSRAPRSTILFTSGSCFGRALVVCLSVVTFQEAARCRAVFCVTSVGWVAGEANENERVLRLLEESRESRERTKAGGIRKGLTRRSGVERKGR